MTRELASPMRARSLHAAMEEASSPRVDKTLSFMSSDDDESDGEQENLKRNDSDDTSNDGKAVSGGTFRYRTRRMERLDVYGRQDPPYRWRLLQSPNKQRRSSSEQSTPTSHRRLELSKRCSRSVSPPCASPATLLSNNLGSTLSMTTPVKIRRRRWKTQVLKKLSVADCLVGLLVAFAVGEMLLIVVRLQLSYRTTLLRRLKSCKPFVGLVLASRRKCSRFEIQKVALFLLSRSPSMSCGMIENDLLVQEIAVLDKLATSSHNFDNIVRYYQAWLENDFFFLQMELCEGGTLQDFITMRNREALPEKYLWIILRDTISGLKILHEHDIVHLDIKPDNIFITEDGRLKIGDFGMAGKVVKSTEKSSKIGELEGDAKYMAKELLSSADRVPSADIFCLGITMLEIATGMDLPEAGKEWHSLREGHFPPFSPEYSEEFSKMIQQMMHPDPTKRPIAAAILKNSQVETTTSEPVSLILEHALKQKLVVPARARSNTSRSARNSLQTPHKTRLSLP